VDIERRPEPRVRLGEALFFTNLIAPHNVSAGTHSRFSCETCHFEGGVDGRTHYTGRGDVSVVTKPLFGLANNRPHFSRALDRDLSSVSHNEFRVSGAGSGTDPWFTVPSAQFGWLRELGIERGQLTALDLREALLAFLYAFSHDPNPRAIERSSFSELEARGARVFSERCESCHSARLLSDDASSHVPLEQWQRLILQRNAPLVWARGDYEKAGILPYVHERGTRITSLRRLSLKPRYFTNGSAASLDDVLERFRFDAARSVHEASPDAAPGLTRLDEPARGALLSFLRLL
jgi:cytochrome c peroxidase